jgi:thiamine biosynthesis protein ThiS
MITAQHKITIFANGNARQVDGQMTIGNLADELKLNPNSVLVECNGSALLHSEWPEQKLEHGDRVEFFRVVAGG